MKHFPFFCVAIVLCGCTCSKSPRDKLVAASSEETVRRFVGLSANAKETRDRKELLGMCTGELRRTFERMSDEAFQIIYLESKLTILDFKVLEKEEKEASSRLTYEVSVDNQQGTSPTVETNQREVQLTQVDGQWYLKEIHVKGTDQVAFTRGMIF